MEFPISRKKGILSYFHQKYGGDINQYINYTTSVPPREGYPLENIFDRNSSSFWISDNNATENNSFTFCFRHHIVKIEAYEIVTPDEEANYCWPYKWGFVGLNSIFENNQDEVIYEHQMSQNDHFQTHYSRSIHQCFRYFNHGYCDVGWGYRSRICEFDIFGTLYPMLFCTSYRLFLFPFSPSFSLFFFVS